MRKNLLAALAALVACSSVHAATVAWYRFENGFPGEPAQGPGTVIDSSGNGLDGTPELRPLYVTADNPNSTVALRFLGAHKKGTLRGTFVHIDDGVPFHLSSLTLEAYVRVTALTGGQQIIVSRGDTAGVLPWFLSITADGRAAFRVAGSKKHSILISPDPLPIGAWASVAGTMDAATGVQSLYVDGVLVASTTTSVRPLLRLPHDRGPTVFLGKVQTPGVSQFLDGDLDEVRISDVALPPSDLLPPP